ncbi:uncharacterized protein STEHIDRAFT_116779 [Stereum hirsutum FP-91666 SS1]|uniref:Uncharacterized protein n=1 Tax=Stereum hirsutum (strain FP-91666) TaxID=721885 RepID=R7RVK7_STEHR|nr:uncharacterized protein STEHIDRAFT_116779 [Stereum hirsutum FP-91666 SS1]EIM79121.1 hypothetical protein STEHIDRAFT_116779 [Stereum hirsutum FP-91666 SS1]
MLDIHAPESKSIISHITQPADSGTLTLQHRQTLSEVTYIRSQLQRTEDANALRLELIEGQHQRSIEELERNRCLEITLFKQSRHTQTVQCNVPGDSKHTIDELVRKHRAEVENLKREFEKRLVERNTNFGKEIGRQHRAEIVMMQRQCEVRVNESVQRAVKMAAKKEAELLKSAEESRMKEVVELEGKLRMRELDFDVVCKEEQEVKERLRKRNFSDNLACQEREELVKKMETTIEEAKDLIVLERDGLGKMLAAARMREKEMVKMRRCIATIKGENRTLWKEVKVLELLRGISQRDIKLATNAVDNHALDYSTSESSFISFPCASGEVTPDTSMSTHKRARSDSEDSMMWCRSSSLLKHIKLDEDHNSPLRIDPSEPRPTPPETPAPMTASPTSSPRKSGVLEYLDSMSTNLVLDGGCGLIANPAIYQEMRKAVEADQYKFVISFSKTTDELSPRSSSSSAIDCPTFPLSPYGSDALLHHILDFCDTLAATQDAMPSSTSAVSDGFEDMFPIMIYRDHHTGTVVSRFFTFSKTDSLTVTDQSTLIQHGPTESRCPESETGEQIGDNDSRSDMDLVSNSGMGSQKVVEVGGSSRRKCSGSAIIPLNDSNSSGSARRRMAHSLQTRQKHNTAQPNSPIHAQPATTPRVKPSTAGSNLEIKRSVLNIVGDAPSSQADFLWVQDVSVDI